VAKRQHNTKAMVRIETRQLRHFLDFAATNAGGTDANALVGAFHYRAYRLQVQIPAPIRNIVRVADFVAELGTPATHFTNSCHKVTL